jgi:hypothetical protein
MASRGAFYWCPKASYMAPAFNTLYLFHVGPESTHFVTQVSPYAQGKRLTINGWWSGLAATGDRVWKGPDRIGTDDTEILFYESRKHDRPSSDQTGSADGLGG